VAVLAPGGNYGPHGPLLLFSAVAARRRGASVRPVDWETERGEEAHAMVARIVAAALAAVLGDVMAAVERFLDDVAWTTAEPAVS
jgi:hypothetical protein